MITKRITLIFVSLFIVFSLQLKADEGMWLLSLIQHQKYNEMQAMGLKLTPEQIYDINNSSLKDAIIQFGRGCTGSIISEEGLILTNHHCGYSQIQFHSSVEHDYLKNGFWAESKAEELPNEGLTARFLVRIDDVTQKILRELNDTMSESERAAKIREVSSKLESEAIKDTHYEASVSTFFEGNEFYLMVYEVFKDVRLVAAPPSSIGKFGADTDNWMWPRHTADFSLFRVYMSPDGKPATYSENNIPYKPKHFLPFSIKGLEKNDFTMTIGYPGSTNRYLTSYGIREAIDRSNPTIVKIREKKLAIMREDMDLSDAVRIQYAAKYAQTSNYWKYFIGQTRGLKRLNVYERKRALENDFIQWVNSNAEARRRYTDIVPSIGRAYELLREFSQARWYFMEAIARGGELIMFSRRFESLYNEIKKADKDPVKIERMSSSLRASLNDFYKDYNLETDKKIFIAMLQMYYADVPSNLQPALLGQIHTKYRGDFNKYATYVYSKTIFADKSKVEAFLNRPNAQILEKDPVFKLMQASFTSYFDMLEKMKTGSEFLSKASRLFVAGLREMQSDRIFYPDANSTMRLSYGRVLDYYPADGVYYNYFTTVDGILEKEDPNNWEFVVDQKLKELIKNRDFGRYAKNGVMHVNFISNNDITGGNSGSPVINGEGQLVGLAFDGNWEAMSGDIVFEPDVQRTISVDARYILFIIDKYAGAQHIINELNIVE
ncbi:MAG: S46 family peptidase [Bacteroidales bacterium]|nr:S46 family peptidase [Bacteroidales bacterium]